MIVSLNNKDGQLAEAVVNLQKKSYIIEARLINFYDIPTLKENISSIMENEEVFFGYFEGEALCGVISYKIIGDVLDIYRLAVDPDYFRRGIAKKLLRHIEDSNVINKLTVSTGAENYPAVKLYLDFGFNLIDIFEVEGGLRLSSFEKLAERRN